MTASVVRGYFLQFSSFKVYDSNAGAASASVSKAARDLSLAMTRSSRMSDSKSAGGKLIAAALLLMA